VIGGIFGDVPFQSLEAKFGDPVTHVFLAICGALFGALTHEIVTMYRGRVDFGANSPLLTPPLGIESMPNEHSEKCRRAGARVHE